MDFINFALLISTVAAILCTFFMFRINNEIISNLFTYKDYKDTFEYNDLSDKANSLSNGAAIFWAITILILISKMPESTLYEIMKP